jgi:mono/diheme cytochrome c family protein
MPRPLRAVPAAPRTDVTTPLVIGWLAFAAMVGGLAASAADHPGLKPYEAHCARCHGEAGRGGNGPRLVPYAFSYEQTVEQVRHPVCDMPAMPASQVSDEDIARIVAYLKTLE